MPVDALYHVRMSSNLSKNPTTAVSTEPYLTHEERYDQKYTECTLMSHPLLLDTRRW